MNVDSAAVCATARDIAVDSGPGRGSAGPSTLPDSLLKDMDLTRREIRRRV